MDHPKNHSLFGLGPSRGKACLESHHGFQGRAFWNFGGVSLVGVVFLPPTQG